MGLDAEDTLRAANRKFRTRFSAMERAVARSKKHWISTTLPGWKRSGIRPKRLSQVDILRRLQYGS